MAFIDPPQGLNFHFGGWISLSVVSLLLIGFIAWITRMQITQSKILRTMATKDDMRQAFENFRNELKS